VGGSARWLWDIFSRLPKDSVAIAAGECPGDREFDLSHELRVTRTPLVFDTWGVLGIRAFARYCRRYRQVCRIARREGARSLFAARILPEGLLALAANKRYGMPFGCFVYGEELNYAAASRELGFLAKQVLRRADKLVSCSQNTVRILTEEWGIRETKIHLLYPGVDVSRFTPRERDSTFRGKIGWGDRPVILTTGRLQKRKGHDVMIRALARIKATIPDILYAIVGGGEELDNLKSLVAELNLAGHVRFHGALPDSDLLESLQQCDLFALPNRQVGQDIEGFGIVLIEAQACGKAVIAGDSGGTAETLDRGRTGVVLDCTTPDALVSTVTAWLHNRPHLETMGRAARDWAVEQFDWNKLAARASELICPTSERELVA
jgi:phosphatidylinositol alpha-1,6-mannosyltransferase